MGVEFDDCQQVIFLFFLVEFVILGYGNDFRLSVVIERM